MFAISFSNSDNDRDIYGAEPVMSIFSGKWWKHHINKLIGVESGAVDPTLKALDNANKDEAGDQRYEGGYEKSNTGESISDAVGQSIAHSEGDDE